MAIPIYILTNSVQAGIIFFTYITHLSLLAAGVLF